MLTQIFFILQRLGQPIQDRHREHEDRPRAFEELGKKLQLYMKFVDSYKQKVSPLLTVMFFHYSFTGKDRSRICVWNCMFCAVRYKYCVMRTGSVIRHINIDDLTLIRNTVCN